MFLLLKTGGMLYISIHNIYIKKRMDLTHAKPSLTYKWKPHWGNPYTKGCGYKDSYDISIFLRSCLIFAFPWKEEVIELD